MPLLFMNRKYYFVLLTLPLLLTSCTFNESSNSADSGSSFSHPSESSSFSDESSLSSYESSLSSSSSQSGKDENGYEKPIIDGTYQERISSMAPTRMIVSPGDSLVSEVENYNELKPLGTCAHPLLDQRYSEYIEIIAVEQPVQYGDAFLIKCGNAEIILDFGNKSSSYYDDNTSYETYLSDLYNSYVLDKKVELVITSHPHSDHIGGFSSFTKSDITDVGMYVDYGYRYYDNDLVNTLRKGNQYGQVYHSIYDMVNNLNGGTSITYITQELFIQWIDTGFYQENPELSSRSLKYKGEEIEDLNITSVAGILHYRNFSFFFDGDMQDKTSYGEINGEAEMIKNGRNQLHQVSMSKVAHHGSTNGTSDNLLNILNPSIAVFSAGRVDEDEVYLDLTGACSGHPHKKTLDRVISGHRSRNTLGYLNSTNGTLHFVNDGYGEIFVQGSPLKSNLIGGVNFKDSVLNIPFGSTKDWSKDLLNTQFYNVCHR